MQANKARANQEVINRNRNRYVDNRGRIVRLEQPEKYVQPVNAESVRRFKKALPQIASLRKLWIRAHGRLLPNTFIVPENTVIVFLTWPGAVQFTTTEWYAKEKSADFSAGKPTVAVRGNLMYSSMYVPGDTVNDLSLSAKADEFGEGIYPMDAMITEHRESLDPHLKLPFEMMARVLEFSNALLRIRPGGRTRLQPVLDYFKKSGGGVFFVGACRSCARGAEIGKTARLLESAIRNRQIKEYPSGPQYYYNSDNDDGKKSWGPYIRNGLGGDGDGDARAANWFRARRALAYYAAQLPPDMRIGRLDEKYVDMLKKTAAHESFFFIRPLYPVPMAISGGHKNPLHLSIGEIGEPVRASMVKRDDWVLTVMNSDWLPAAQLLDLVTRAFGVIRSLVIVDERKRGVTVSSEFVPWMKLMLLRMVDVASSSNGNKSNSSTPPEEHLLAAITRHENVLVQGIVAAHPELLATSEQYAIRALNNPDLLQYLLRHGAPADASTLVKAVDYPQSLKILLGERPGLASWRDGDGMTPLMRAAKFGRAPAMRALLEHPATNVRATNGVGMSALHHAWKYRVLTADARRKIKLLLSAGANPHQKNHAGATPYDLALRHSNAKLADSNSSGNYSNSSGSNSSGSNDSNSNGNSMRALLKRSRQEISIAPKRPRR